MDQQVVDGSSPALLPNETFQHSPLYRSDCIRILTVLPADSLELPLECEIETRKLDKSANYEALSYSWGMNADGDDALSRSIFIIGRVYAITQNLFEGLLRLRAGAWPWSRRLWIDAVCIDQADLAERSEQVLRMASIYKNATRTVVWLGEGESEREDLNVLAISKCLKQALGASHTSGTHLLQDRNGDKHNICLLHHPEHPKPLEPDDFRPTVQEDCRVRVARSAISVLSRRYFYRRWIFQELWNSSRHTSQAYWGPCSSDLVTLRDMALEVARMVGEYASEKLPHSDRDYPMVIRLLKIALILGPAGGIANYSLPQALETCDDMYCSDVRDRLYSLLAVDSDFDIHPDYQLSPAAVSVRFARELVDKDYLYFVLSNSAYQRGRNVSTPIKLRSWVPNLAGSFQYRQGKEPKFQSLVVAITDDDILTLTPYLCGIVKEVDEGQRSMVIECLERDNPRARADRYSNLRMSKRLIRPHRHSTNDIYLSIEPRHTNMSFKWGDLCCSLTSDVSEACNCIFFLRPHRLEKEELVLIDTFSWHDVLRSEHMQKNSCPGCPERKCRVPRLTVRTTVNIV